jgi:hypothetical protein
VADPHFAGRGLFAHKVVAANGTAMPALPLPLDPGFRAAPRAVATTRPGADNGMI